MKQLTTVWHHAYMSEAAPMNSTTKGADLMDRLLDPVTSSIRMVAPVFRGIAATAKEVATIHDPWYVEAVRTGAPRRLAESQGFSWSPEFAESVFRIWDGQRYAVHLAKELGMVLHPVSGAHHAGPDRGGGFCTFNFLMQPSDGMTAIIDLDAHHGDGTKAFLDRDLSLPVKQFDLWVDSGPYVGTSIEHNSFYAGYNNVTTMFTLLGQLPRWLDMVMPDHVVYQAGVDPYRHDPMGGAPGVDFGALQRRDAQVIAAVRERKIPLVVVLAGGYSDRAVQLHQQTVEVMRGYI